MSSSDGVGRDAENARLRGCEVCGCDALRLRGNEAVMCMNLCEAVWRLCEAAT